MKSNAQNETKKMELILPIRVPTKFVEDIRNYNPDTYYSSLILQFDSLISPDSLYGSKIYEEKWGGFFTHQFINLDEDTAKELLCLFGWSEDYPTMAVFKNINNSWFLLYTENFYIFYRYPEIKVVKNSAVDKTFYIRWLYERGTGVYCDALHFYKIIDKKVYHCLELINESRIYGWGLSLNQSINMSYKFDKSGNDQLKVTYNYSFFPGDIFDDSVDRSKLEKLFFVKAKKSIIYKFDNNKYSYQPQYGDKADDLNAEKIACFTAFGNDSLFVKAYANEIKYTLEKGKNDEKILLKKYLKIVAGNKKAISPNGELEKKTKIGDLEFYELKEKKEEEK